MLKCNGRNFCQVGTYASSRQFEKAEKACDDAITSSKKLAETDTSATRFVSIALNNRAILRTKTQDYKGALQDLMTASEMKNIAFIESNLLKLIRDQAESIQFEALQLTQL